MGSPRKQRKKFSKPNHPWQKDRIVAEKELSKDYGLRRKYELWKMNSILKNFTTQAKSLIAATTDQSEKERGQLLNKLSSLGLIKPESKIEDVLSLTLKDVMERRLQTLVYRKSLSHSLKQARQFITHQHISVGTKTITAPSYLVPLDEESGIQFIPNSSLSNPEHPERAVKEEKPKKAAKKEEKKNKVEAEEGKKESNAEDKKEAKEKKSPEAKKESPKKEEVKKAEDKKEIEPKSESKKESKASKKTEDKKEEKKGDEK